MLFEEFKNKLEANEMNLKTFGELSGLSYSTVTKWKYLKEVPPWVKSWFEMYEKVKKLNNLKSQLIEFSETIKNI